MFKSKGFLVLLCVVVVVLCSFFLFSCGGGSESVPFSGEGGTTPEAQSEISELFKTQSLVKEFYEELEAESDPDALRKTISFLKEQDSVKEAAIGEDDSIWIKYSSGVEAIIVTKLFEPLVEPLDLGPSSRLKTDGNSYGLLARENGKKAIILLPIDSMLKYKDESVDDIELCLKQGGYSVAIYRDRDVTVDLMRNLSDCAFIYMTTHGGIGPWGNIHIATGEIADVNATAKLWSYLISATDGITIFSYKGSDDFYFGVNCNFFDNYLYPGSFIYMNACSSLRKDNLADAFLNNGANIFIGWDNTSFVALGSFHNSRFFNQLAESGNPFKNAYNAVIALYYPCNVYKDDNRDGNYRVLFSNSLDAGDREDATFDYTLNLKYKGNPDFVLNLQYPENSPPVIPEPETASMPSEPEPEIEIEPELETPINNNSSNAGIRITTLTELGVGSKPIALAISNSDDNLYCVFSSYIGVFSLTIINTISGEKLIGMPMLPPPGAPLVNDIDISYDDEHLYISDSTAEYSQIIVWGDNSIRGAIKKPIGVAVSHSGKHLYVTDIDIHGVYDIDLDSRGISLLVGSGVGYSDGTGSEARFNTPVGIAINPSDTKLYVAEPHNNRIREINIASKNVITFAGSGIKETKDGIGTNASFNDPAYITVNRAGTKLYVVEYDGATVREIDIVTKKVSTLIDKAAGLKDPRDIVISHNDSVLYIADYGNSRVLAVSLKIPDPDDKTPPSIPTGLAISTALSELNQAEIKLSWDKSIDNAGIGCYKIFRDGAYLKSVRSSSFFDLKLDYSTQYCYVVSACDEAGNESGQSSQVCATTLPPETGFRGTVYYSTTSLAGIRLVLRNSKTLADIPGTEVLTNENGNYKILCDVPGEYEIHVYLPPEYVSCWSSPSPWTLIEGKLRIGDLYLSKPLILISPSEGEVINKTTPTFIWEKNPEASYYELLIFVCLPKIQREKVFLKTVQETSYTLSESESLLTGNYWLFIIGKKGHNVVAQGERMFVISP